MLTIQHQKCLWITKFLIWSWENESKHMNFIRGEPSCLVDLKNCNWLKFCSASLKIDIDLLKGSWNICSQKTWEWIPGARFTNEVSKHSETFLFMKFYLVSTIVKVSQFSWPSPWIWTLPLIGVTSETYGSNKSEA